MAITTTTDVGEWAEYVMLDGVTEDTTSDALSIDTRTFKEVKVLVSVTTTATVSVQGRFASVDEWIPLADDITASGGVVVYAFPVMRAVSTDVSGALTVAFRGER